MRWLECAHSKTKVRTAGKTLSKGEYTGEELSDALDVLSSWRAAHAYPMHAILILLRRKAFEVNGRKTLVVQRLKRTPSIVKKLCLYKNMSLDGMQDIGGCRAVLPTISKVRKLYIKLKESKTRHKLHGEKDYIINPKKSGYRGIHLIYKYNARKKIYAGYRVEIQLRSQVQHSWATALEVIDTFTGQALKSGLGEAKWHEFFRVVGSAFASLESTPIDIDFKGVDLFALTKKLEKELNVLVKLRAFAVSAEHISKGKEKKSEYYLLQLKAKDNSIVIYDYNAKQLEWATLDYITYEKSFSDDPSVDVVLVSASTINSLRRAYPNYFADTDAFVRNLEKVIKLAE